MWLLLRSSSAASRVAMATATMRTCPRTTRMCIMPVRALSTPAAAAASSSAPSSSSDSTSNTTVVGPQGAFNESEYAALKARAQAEAMKEWREFQATNPNYDFPSPDGLERPTTRVLNLVKDIFALNMLEAFQLRVLIEKHTGFSVAASMAPAAAAAAPAAAAGAAPAAEAASAAEAKKEATAPTSFTLRLDSFNAADKIKVIKEVRAITGLGLKESKDLVESLPKPLKKDLSKADADALVAKLKEAGAVVALE